MLLLNINTFIENFTIGCVVKPYSNDWLFHKTEEIIIIVIVEEFLIDTVWT